jgi:copper(I)-binding protein
MRYAISLLGGLLLLFAGTSQAPAQTPTTNTIQIEQPWARATPGGARTGVVYLGLSNNGTANNQLLSATTPVSETVQFHQQFEENGVSRMRELLAVEIRASSTIAFKPGGMHVMLVGLADQRAIDRNFSLGQAINGTPGFVIGDAAHRSRRDEALVREA